MIANQITSYEKFLSHEELAVLKEWFGEDSHVFSTEEQGCTYYIYSDGSLYFSSTGDSEIWNFAIDFAQKKIIDGYDQAITGMDSKLLEHLGIENPRPELAS